MKTASINSNLLLTYLWDDIILTNIPITMVNSQILICRSTCLQCLQCILSCKVDYMCKAANMVVILLELDVLLKT